MMGEVLLFVFRQDLGIYKLVGVKSVKDMYVIIRRAATLLGPPRQS